MGVSYLIIHQTYSVVFTISFCFLRAALSFLSVPIKANQPGLLQSPASSICELIRPHPTDQKEEKKKKQFSPRYHRYPVVTV